MPASPLASRGLIRTTAAPTCTAKQREEQRPELSGRCSGVSSPRQIDAGQRGLCSSEDGNDAGRPRLCRLVGNLLSLLHALRCSSDDERRRRKSSATDCESGGCVPRTLPPPSAVQQRRNGNTKASRGGRTFLLCLLVLSRARAWGSGAQTMHTRSPSRANVRSLSEAIVKGAPCQRAVRSACGGREARGRVRRDARTPGPRWDVGCVSVGVSASPRVRVRTATPASG